MARLTRSDMEAALAFAAEVGTAASHSERADAWILDRLAELVPLEVASYAQIEDGPAHRILSFCDHDVGPILGQVPMPTGHDLELWLTENPFCNYADRNRNPYFAAIRLSDLIEWETFSRTEFAAMFDPVITKEIQTRIPGSPGTHWSLGAGRGGRDYSQRDLLMLDALRPSLFAYESVRALTGAMAALARTPVDARGDVLSRRENEVLDLVAAGATNAQIAQDLWISPATVKKHLENVYAKLEVSSRTAALAQSGRSLTSDAGRTSSR